ncbi:hypothetical protein DCAR_0312887 [Daucus carota subsp. sativus]|uniref:DUF295 domain-containing protein n=1 Tax=Daucus carota subsp. sativus TaxID=79200 RepID=A0A162AKX0_DAUCS|nr:hypothetical protein DCAR_0312887 [Daucus carota subsp. sativus]
MMVSLFSYLEDFTVVEKEKNQQAVKKTSEDKKLSLLSKLLMNLSRRTMEKLCFADQIRFNGISKRWLYLDKYRKAPSGSLPCFASVEKLQNGNLQCQFYESSDFNPFSVDKIDLGYEAFELNGELGLVYFYDDELNGGYDDCEKLGYVRIFDQADKIWVRLESLGHRALYVSSNTFSISADGEEARKNGVLPGKIYRTDRSGCVSVYSLVKGDLFKFSPCPGSRNREEVVDGKLGFWVEPRYQLQTESRYKKW